MRKPTLLASCALLLLVAVGSPAYAVPNTVGLTANVEDAGGPIDGAVTMTFAIFDDPTAGALLWEEIQDLTADNGLVFAELGSVDPVANGLDATVFAGGDVWLELTVNGDPQSPRITIGSVPYAVRAGVADKLGDLSPGDVALSGHDHDGDYLPVGTVSSCSGATPVVTGIETATGDVICAADADTTYSAGAGIQIAGTAISADFAAVAPADHDHDDRYATETELGSSGTINDAGNPVDWTRLKSVPGDFADGTDDDTTYAAGSGLSLSSTTFSVAPADFNAPIAANSATGAITMASGSAYQTIRQLTITAPVAGQVALFGNANARCDSDGCGAFVNAAGTAGWDTDEIGAPAFTMSWRARGSGGGSATVTVMHTAPVSAGSSTFYLRADCVGPDSCTYDNRQVMAWFIPQ
jgi:hypothetical protein